MKGGKARREKGKGCGRGTYRNKRSGRGGAKRGDAMQGCFGCPVYGLNSTPGQPEGKMRRERRTVRTLESYLGAQAMYRKEGSLGLRSSGKIGRRREDWCGRVSVVEGKE